MNADIKAWSHWLMGYGLSRATLKLLARRGGPFAQLLIDISQPTRRRARPHGTAQRPAGTVRTLTRLALAGEPSLNNNTLPHGINHLPVNPGPTRANAA